MTEFAVAVRELAEFCHRCGDIDYRFTPSPTGEEGMAGHQLVQGQRGSSYQAEYSLQAEYEFENFRLLLRGRADGWDAERGIVEEIKTCRVDASAIPPQVEQLHWAQALIYGGLVLQQEPARDDLEIHLTWLNIDSEQQWTRAERLTRAELVQFLSDTVNQYSRWLEQLNRWRERRDHSIEALAFPHPSFRAGQRELAESVYKCASQGGNLLLQAPTGIGKTAAVLFPALKAIATDKHDFLVYLTARTVGRHAAEQTLDEMAAAGLQLRRLTLSARDNVCLSPGRACHGDDCPYARGYYDRLPEALQAAIQQPRLGRENLEQLAREFEICPYQLSIDLLPWVDVCIADVHYVYSFNATVASTCQQRAMRWTVLLDEAHNLPDRARSMYSATLSKSALMKARKQAQGQTRKALDRFNRALLALQKEKWQEPEFDSRGSVPDSLQQALHALLTAIAEWQSENPLALQQHPLLLDFYFKLLQFQRVLEVFGDDYRFELSRAEDPQSLQVHLHCLDGSRQLQERQEAAHSVTAFSATVSPPHWVMSELGFGEKAVFRKLDSPFALEQYQVYLHTGLDTRFRARERSLAGLCELISAWLEDNPGNCIVYFPAYQYLQDVLHQLGERLSQRQVIVQVREQTEVARAELLGALRERRDVVAFCILGGVFGEGIDLPGDALTSVVIIGVGLPQFNRERQVLRDYYEHKHGQGYQFAYQYPGMQKISQALGRVIRTETDRGAALLVDPRYAQAEYRELLPPWWDYKQFQ